MGLERFCCDLSLTAKKAIFVTHCGYGVIGSRARLRIWCRKAWGFESLYPHKGAFFRGSFFVARPAQKEENRLYIIILQRLRPIPRTENEKTARRHWGCPNCSDSPSLHS